MSIRILAGEKQLIVLKAYIIQCDGTKESVTVYHNNHRIRSSVIMREVRYNDELFYEQDILEGRTEANLPIRGILLFSRKAQGYCLCNSHGEILLSKLHDVKLIGNIYENTDLAAEELFGGNNGNEIKELTKKAKRDVDTPVYICPAGVRNIKSGWAYILDYKGTTKKRFGVFNERPSQSATELMACLTALRKVKGENPVHIIFQSHYCSDAINNNMIDFWNKNDWKKANGEPLKNQNIWKALQHEIAKHGKVTASCVSDEADPSLIKLATESFFAAEKAAKS